MGSRNSGNRDNYGSSGSRPRRSRAGKEYSQSQIDYVAPSAEYSDMDGYSRRISSDSYHSIHHKKARRKKIVIAVVAVAAALLIGGGAAAFGYLSYLNNQFHSGIEDLDALNEALVVTDSAPTDPFYVLLMGTDGRPGEETYRSDSIILARIDPGNKRCVLVSIPRDTYAYVEGSGGMDKINAAFAYGGPVGAVNAVENFAGVDISHYAEINFESFCSLVDALGGVEVDVPIEIDDPDAGGYVPAGVQVLDGEHALIFCRSRATIIGDYQRQANQRIFLQAVASKVLASDPGTMLNAINAIAASVSTDMNVDEIYSIANSLKGLTPNDIYTYTVPSEPELIDGVSYIVPDEEAWTEMMSIIDSGGLPDEQVWDIAGVIPDEYNAAANADGAAASSDLNIDYTQYPITVRNGGGIEGSASAVADRLASAGYQINDTGNTSQFVYDDTLVIYNDAADLAVANDIVRILGVGTPVESAGRYEFDGRLMVVVGSDYAQ